MKVLKLAEEIYLLFSKSQNNIINSLWMLTQSFTLNINSAEG